MTIKIYKPTKTSMQSGFKKTKLWLAEYISDVEKVKDKSSYITPVPGGVGPMTIACLLKNTIDCFKRSQI